MFLSIVEDSNKSLVKGILIGEIILVVLVTFSLLFKYFLKSESFSPFKVDLRDMEFLKKSEELLEEISVAVVSSLRSLSCDLMKLLSLS